MPIRIETYTADGIATGMLARAGRLRDVVECGTELLVERATWYGLDGSGPRPPAELRVAPDDLYVIVGDQPEDGPVHAQWHSITLDLGPYRLTGEMPTLPGFDPGRALARPTGEFVLLRDVRIELLGRDDVGNAEIAQALVNRYVVDRVEADMILGFFFPGAEMIVTGAPEIGSAGVAAGVSRADEPAASATEVSAAGAATVVVGSGPTIDGA
jgi:hypothetical protein